MNTTLQVPVDASLKSRATKAAKAMGFSSLQEIVRVFLQKLADGEIHIEFVANQKNASLLKNNNSK